jgi:hypothetical protein
MLFYERSFGFIYCCGRHRFDADPEPTFHFDADPDLDPTATSKQVEKSEFFILLITAMLVSFSTAS